MSGTRARGEPFARQLRSSISPPLSLPVSPRLMGGPEPSTSPRSWSTPRDCKHPHLFHRSFRGLLSRPSSLPSRYFIQPYAQEVTTNYIGVPRCLIINAVASTLVCRRHQALLQRESKNYFCKSLLGSKVRWEVMVEIIYPKLLLP